MRKDFILRDSLKLNLDDEVTSPKPCHFLGPSQSSIFASLAAFEQLVKEGNQTVTRVPARYLENDAFDTAMPL